MSKLTEIHKHVENSLVLSSVTSSSTVAAAIQEGAAMTKITHQTLISSMNALSFL
jgi:hypothetical protein